MALRSAIATVALFAIALALGRLALPPRADLPVLLSITLLHMVGFGVLAAWGLRLVPTGRSVVLAYTTPLWVVPGAGLFLGERLTARRMVGVSRRPARPARPLQPARLRLDQPQRDARQRRDPPRRGPVGGQHPAHPRPPLAVDAVRSRALGDAAGHRHRDPARARDLRTRPTPRGTAGSSALLLYAGIPGTAVAYWATAMASRNLPAVTTSLGLLATPVVSVVVATLWLGEPLTVALVRGDRR